MVALALKNRKITFTSLSNNFDMPIAGHLLKLLGVIPTPGTVYQTELFINNCNKILEKRKTLHIYPEGHLYPYYNGLREFNKGTFKIANKNNAPILPVVLSWRKRKGIYKLWLGEKPCININIGKPIYPNLELPKNEQTSYLREACYSAMNDLYTKNNKLNISNSTTLERMNKLQAEIMFTNLYEKLSDNEKSKLNNKLVTKAKAGKLKKKDLLKLIYKIKEMKKN